MNFITNKQDLRNCLTKNMKVLALFFASWCPFCQNFVPFFNQNTIASGFDQVVHVMLDDYDNPLWDEYRIESVPSVIFFQGGGVYKRIDGKLGKGIDENQFLEWFRQL